MTTKLMKREPVEVEAIKPSNQTEALTGILTAQIAVIMDRQRKEGLSSRDLKDLALVIQSLALINREIRETLETTVKGMTDEEIKQKALEILGRV